MSHLQGQQVTALPSGSGVSKELHENHTKLAMMTAQAKANTVFDPSAPKPLTSQVIQPFCDHGEEPVMAEWIAAVGVIFLAYGILAVK